MSIANLPLRSRSIADPPSAGTLPPARCDEHAHAKAARPCPACMRAAQRRLAAHNASSEAARREWELRRVAIA